ncbi:hypothetical protein [Aurantibacillus circumpalustris]|uniref:hypothetical protein n=1 Tax=Aurantibacillus circumpalustris TaxID=3036359 RepID=UPI00295AF8AE|nr:hypothetical protein [Aurantibacillus circumpalustris]
MSRDKRLQAARNKAIKEAYAKLEGESVNGARDVKVQKYSRDAILAILARRFYLLPETISKIVLAPEDEDNENQLELFND